MSSRAEKLISEARDNFDAGDTRAALRKFYEVWTLLEQPKTEHAMAASVLESIGDCYQRMEKYEQSCEALSSSLFCKYSLDKGQTHVKIAENYLMLNDDQKAKEHLAEAYKISGRDAFKTKTPRLLMMAMESSNQG